MTLAQQMYGETRQGLRILRQELHSGLFVITERKLLQVRQQLGWFTQQTMEYLTQTSQVL